MKMMSAVMSLILSVLGGVVGAAAYQTYVVPPPQRVRIVDMRSEIAAISEDPALTEEGKKKRATEFGTQVKTWIDEQVLEGAIVLDGALVLGAPSGMYVGTHNERQ